MWFPQKEESKLYASGKLTYSGATREEKIGFISMKKGTTDTKYVMQGWLKFPPEITEGSISTEDYVTTHCFYLYKVENNFNFLSGYILPFEDRTTAGGTSTPPKSNATAKSFSGIPF